MAWIIDSEADLSRLIAAAVKAAVQPTLERIMTALTDLQAADAAIQAAVAALAAEQSTFLADVAASLPWLAPTRLLWLR
jgi:hypothetical protein